MKTLTLNRRTTLILIAVLLGQVVAIGMAQLVLLNPLYAGVVVYALLFWALAWYYPNIVLMSMLALAPFQHDLSGGGPVKLGISEINAFLAVPVFLIRCYVENKRPSLGPLAVPVVLILGISAASAFVNWRGGVAINSLLQMGMYLVVTIWLFSSYARRSEDFYPALHGYIIACTLLALIAIAIRTNYILGLHKNSLGASLSYAVVISAELWFAARQPRHKALLLLALVIISLGLLVSLSRGGWLSAACGLMIVIALRRQFKSLLLALVVIAPLVAVMWNTLPQESRDYALDFNPAKRRNIEQRYKNEAFARDHYEKNPVFGVGIGLRKQYDATNIVWCTLAETGWIGLSSFALLHLVFYGTIWRLQKRVLQTDPNYSLMALGGALVLSKLMHGMVDHYWQRGTLMVVWSAAGMAIYAYLQSQRAARNTVPFNQTFIHGNAFDGNAFDANAFDANAFTSRSFN